jgi:hypothetical protein
MTPLPWDYFRCKPDQPDSFCCNCKRWADHPEQTHNPYGQSFVSVTDSRNEACDYIPISFLEDK